MSILCQTSAEADFIDQQNEELRLMLEESKNFMRSVRQRESLKVAQLPFYLDEKFANEECASSVV